MTDSLFEEEAPRSSGRRSKLDIACDVLDVISKGAERRTRIMQLANVTWYDLVMYLEALIRNQLLSREIEGKTVRYSLTAKGRALLDHYLSLKREAASLNLGAISRERITKALAPLATSQSRDTDLYSSLERRIRTDGLKILDPKITGKSGAVHTLGIVAERADGSKHGYIIVRDVDEAQMMQLFVTQLDTNLSIHLFYTGKLQSKVEALARAYSLDLQRLEESQTNAAKPGS